MMALFKGGMTPLFWFALGATFYAAVSPVPALPPGAPSDKVQHIIAFTVLSGLAVAAYPRAAWQRLLIGLIGFGALIECVQAIPVLQRSAEWMDLLADSAAVAVSLVLISGVRKLFLR